MHSHDHAHKLTHILLDWGNTLMADLPGQKGPMAQWPEVFLMPDVARTLPLLAEGRTLAVASGAQDSDVDAVRKALERGGIDHYFQHILLASEIGFPKALPEFYTQALFRLGVQPAHAMMIGDKYETDIMPAKAAGLRTILVTTSAGRFPDADAVVPTISHAMLFIE